MEPSKNILCKSCGFSGTVGEYDPSVSVYADIHCPKCGSTNNEQNEEYQSRILSRMREISADENPMDDKRIAEIKARCEAATKGPWRRVSPEYGEASIKDAEDYTVFNSCINWPFIAHARQDIPDILDALEEAREERDRYRAIVQGIADELPSLNKLISETGGDWPNTFEGGCACERMLYAHRATQQLNTQPPGTGGTQ